MSIFKSITLMITMLFALFGTALASTQSACGGSANNPCHCYERYVCDNGNCGCQRDQYCADTNCRSGSSLSPSRVKEEAKRDESDAASSNVARNESNKNLNFNYLILAQAACLKEGEKCDPRNDRCCQGYWCGGGAGASCVPNP